MLSRQDLVLACDLQDEEFFELSGLLPNQMLYLVWLTTGRLRYDADCVWCFFLLVTLESSCVMRSLPEIRTCPEMHDVSPLQSLC